MCERIIAYHTLLETGSLFVYTIISLKQPQFFLALVKNSLSLTFLSEVLSLIRPDFSLLSLYYWSVLPTYSAYKTTQHQQSFMTTHESLWFRNKTCHKPKIIYSAWNAELLNSVYVLLVEMVQLCLKTRERNSCRERPSMCSSHSERERTAKHANYLNPAV